MLKTWSNQKLKGNSGCSRIEPHVKNSEGYEITHLPAKSQNRLPSLIKFVLALYFGLKVYK